MLLVHGGSGSWVHWCRNITHLAENGRLVCVPDLPGCGDSSPPPNGEDGDALPVWINAGARTVLGSSAFDLVGFSFGGMVSGLFAASYPDQVRKLVLVDAAALGHAAVSPVGLKQWSRLAAGPERTAAIRFNLGRLMFARDEFIDELSLQLYLAGLERDRLPNRRLAKTDILSRTLPQLRCPVWGIWGDSDVLFRDAYHFIEPSLRQAPHFRALTLVANAGHWVQFEAAAAFNASLQGILSQ